MLISDIELEIAGFLMKEEGDLREFLKGLTRKHQVNIYLIEETEDEKFFVREMKLPTDRYRIRIKDRTFIYAKTHGDGSSETV